MKIVSKKAPLFNKFSIRGGGTMPTLPPLNEGPVWFENITFYTEILTQKVELWIISLMKENHKATFLVKISV